MFNDKALNTIFYDALAYDDYAILCEMAHKYSQDPENTAIHQIITLAIDQLHDAKPMPVIELQTTMDNYSDKYSSLIANQRMECIHEHIRLQDKTREFVDYAGIDLERYPVNFRNFAANTEAVTRLKSQPRVIDTLFEIEASNRVIDEYKEDIRILSDQFLAYDDWKASDEGRIFIKTYAKARKKFVMNGRNVEKLRKFAL